MKKLLALVLVLLSALAIVPRASAQVSIQFRDSTNTVLATYVSGMVVFKCDTNLTCTPSGLTVDMQPASGGGGSLTSVVIVLPSQFASPTSSTTSGVQTTTIAWNNQSQNYIFAGPASGGSGPPLFRALVLPDIPAGTLGQCIVTLSGPTTGWGSCSGTSTVVQVNGTNVTTQSPINFQSGSAVDGITITAANPSAGNVDFAISGTLTVPGGGTGAATFTATELLCGAGASPIAPCNLSQDVTTSGSAVATVVGLQTVSVSSTAPTNGQALIYNSGTSKWTPTTVGGGGSCPNCVLAVSPGAGIAHFAGSTQTVTSSAVSLTADVSGILPIANGGTNTNSTLTGIVRGGSSFTASELSGDCATSGSNVVTCTKINGVAFSASPSTNTVPVVTGTNATTYEAVPNAALANSATTVNGTTCTLGSTCTITAGSSGISITVPNDTVTGTTVNKLAKMTSAQRAIITATTDTGAVQVGIVSAGAGTSGNATIITNGVGVSCVFDGGTTAGDWVINSVTTAGDCHDTASSTYPTTYGNVVGIVRSTNSGAGTYTLDMSNVPTGNGVAPTNGLAVAFWTGSNSLGISPTTYASGEGWYMQTNGVMQVGDCCNSHTVALDLQPSSTFGGVSFQTTSSSVYPFRAENSSNALIWGTYTSDLSSDYGARELLYGALTAYFPNNSGGTTSGLAQIVGTSNNTFKNALTTSTWGGIGVGDNTFAGTGFGVIGPTGCVADNTTVLGDYIVLGTSTAGRCRDAGANWPFAGQPFGRAMNAVSAGSTADVLLDPEVRGGAFGVYSNTISGATSAAGPTTMVTVGATATEYRFTGSINCTTTSAAAVATLALSYTDTASTVQTISIQDTCTSLVTTGVPQEVIALRAKASTAITWQTTITNTPTFDSYQALEQMN